MCKDMSKKCVKLSSLNPAKIEKAKDTFAKRKANYKIKERKAAI